MVGLPISFSGSITLALSNCLGILDLGLIWYSWIFFLSDRFKSILKQVSDNMTKVCCLKSLADEFHTTPIAKIIDIVRGQTMSYDSHGYREWIVNVWILKYVVHSSFFVYIFLSPVPQKSDNWSVAATIVGLHSIFAISSSSRCCNYQRQRNAKLLRAGLFAWLMNQLKLISALVRPRFAISARNLSLTSSEGMHLRIDQVCNSKVGGAVVEENDVWSL